MQAIQREELMPNQAYASAREGYRREIIDYKRDRRVELGPQVTFVFENRKTLLFQLQEILRVEGISDPAGIDGELEVYNALLPLHGALSATVMIEFSGTESIREARRSLVGLMETLRLVVGDTSYTAQFEQGRETEERISAVQYVGFALGEAGAEALRAALGETGRPILYVAGHVHRFSYTQDDRYPGLQHLTTGAFFLQRQGQPERGAFSVIRIDRDGFQVDWHERTDGWDCCRAIPHPIPDL